MAGRQRDERRRTLAAATARHRTSFRGRAGLGSAVVVVLVGAGCQTDAPAHRDIPTTLEPRGTGARLILEEMALHLVFGTAVFLLVIGLLVGIVWRRRSRPSQLVEADGEARGRRWIWLGGIALPVVVLAIVFSMSMRNFVALGSPPEPATIEIEVIGHRWWWEVHYVNEGIRTANEIHVPVGEAVNLRLTSSDVIHTFWVPQVQRKLDLIPGETNQLWLEAEEPGIFRGICAEFCGLQHARMHFLLVAMEPERFDEWVEGATQPAPPPEAGLVQQGHDVFMSNSCVHCHAISGTPATGTAGPDLTNLASRLTLAGGVYRNNTGNLAGWIVDPQAMKPGALMPSTPLTGEELNALLAYLDTLE